MCGIFCVFSTNSSTESIETSKQTYNECRCNIERRGPDSQNTLSLTFEEHHFLFATSVLWLQGEKLTPQPIQTDNSIFLYNGDIFDGAPADSPTGDTKALHDLLETSVDLLALLVTLRGPYAFVYFDKRKLRLYFCRDPFGRRSLLVGGKNEHFLITSVASKTVEYDCCELPPLGVFYYELNTLSWNLIPFAFKHLNFSSKLNELENKLNVKISVLQSLNLPSKSFTNPTENELSLFQLKQQKPEQFFMQLLTNKVWLDKVTTLKQILERAIASRIQKQPKVCKNCIFKQSSCKHCKVGVLFSGGVDCAILALIAETFIDEASPIDLLNVSFASQTPDRLTGLETYKELQELRPNRNWNFVEIDVNEHELNLERSSRICDLIYPLNTILDDSLGCALWFASRGQNSAYKSPCRVLLVGMGADELFGGYTKHRAALKRGGWSALNQSLEDDWQNISHRNLARDDRVVSDHGRQLRTPYLDENVVDYVRKLNCWERTIPSESLPQGVGEKILLRSLAFHMGLRNAAVLKKRALQFGCRIANSKENANHTSPRL